LDSQFSVLRGQGSQALSQASQPFLLIKPFYDLCRLIVSVGQAIFSAEQVFAVNYMLFLPLHFQADKPGDATRIRLYFADLLAIRLRCHSIEDFIGEVFRPRAMIPLKEFRQSKPNVRVPFPCTGHVRIKARKQSR
jgi:hypothetical protein